MDKIQYRQIHDPADQALEQVERLFSQMYDHMQQHGLMLALDANGVEKWISSLRRNLQRFSVLLVAAEADRVIGFAHGALGMTPDYLGNRKVGVVTHIFVLPAWRKQNVAARMLKGLEQWFRDQQVHSIELQVLTGNTGAIKFWEQAGYTRELLQFRKENK